MLRSCRKRIADMDRLAAGWTRSRLTPEQRTSIHGTTTVQYHRLTASKCRGTFPTGYGLGVTAMKITALKRFASGVTLLALMGSATAFAQQSNKPNVVFILADNVGHGDLGSYGWGELSMGR